MVAAKPDVQPFDGQVGRQRRAKTHARIDGTPVELADVDFGSDALACQIKFRNAARDIVPPQRQDD